MKTAFRIVCLVVLLTFRSSLVFAQHAAVDDAREHFQRGVDFYKSDSFDAALDEFKQAYELAANYRVLFNIGQVQLERRDYVAALTAFQNYLELGSKDISAERREQVERDVNVLNQRVAHLRIKSTVNDAEVAVNGVPVARTPMAASVLVNPGLVHLSVRKDGYRTSSQTFTLAAAETKVVVADLQLEGNASPSAPDPALEQRQSESPPPSSLSHRSYTRAWIGLGVTGGLAVATTVLALRAHQLNNELDQRLDTFPGDARAIDSARSSVKHYALATDIVGGCAAAALGLTLYFAASPSTEGSPTKLSLTTFPGGTGLQFVNHF